MKQCLCDDVIKSLFSSFFVIQRYDKKMTPTGTSPFSSKNSTQLNINLLFTRQYVTTNDSKKNERRIHDVMLPVLPHPPSG